MKQNEKYLNYIKTKKRALLERFLINEWKYILPQFLMMLDMNDL